jgi:hypothetical protein
VKDTNGMLSEFKLLWIPRDADRCVTYFASCLSNRIYVQCFGAIPITVVRPTDSNGCVTGVMENVTHDNSISHFLCGSLFYAKSKVVCCLTLHNFSGDICHTVF